MPGRPANDERDERGFGSVSEFISYWTTLHGIWNPTQLVFRIGFSLTKRCPDCAALPGVPA